MGQLKQVEREYPRHADLEEASKDIRPDELPADWVKRLFPRKEWSKR